MKSSFRIIVLLIGTWAGILISGCDKNSDTVSAITELIVKNSGSDTITTYLTLGGGDKWVSDVNGVFGITGSGLQGSFQIAPNESVSYTCPQATGIRGNISFERPPLNCPFETSTNLFEFTLNNAGTVDKAQETVDISCVSGINCIGKMDFSGGGEWIANSENKNIKTIQNDTLYHNIGRIGVYPFGCDSCTVHYYPPSCSTHPPFSHPQSESICNISRSADLSGGSVTITYLSKIN